MKLQLNKSLVRPYLKHSVQIWRHAHFRKDTELIEVQRRATKLFLLLREKKYEERLRILKLTTLKTRKIIGDLIELFKIFKVLRTSIHAAFLLKALHLY